MAGAFAASKGGYGYRRVKAMLRTGVSEKVIRGIMAEDGPTVHVPERRGYGRITFSETPVLSMALTLRYPYPPLEAANAPATRTHGPAYLSTPSLAWWQ
ncbi:hypothetical protein MCC02034_11650 [Bifidobacteriaceae bacterium MCC02034]|nr:hypothetical protein MCC02034_11650 [Bifidobacteriaceae bacterium MCC02034]